MMALLVAPIAREVLNRPPMLLGLSYEFAGLPEQFEQPLRAWCFWFGHANTVSACRRQCSGVTPEPRFAEGA